MFRHDLSNTGYSTSTAPTTNQTLWNYTTGDIIYSSPAVVGGVVFVGSFYGNVYAFATPTYDVTFTETGLASGTAWAVTFNGVIHMTTLDSISFTVPNGVYAYSVKVPSGYSSSSTLSGNLIVADENVTKNIIFTQDEYATVGGELSQTGYIESFLVSTLVMIGISGAICMLGFIRIKRSKQPRSKPHNA